jgi:hypothetical protein
MEPYMHRREKISFLAQFKKIGFDNSSWALSYEPKKLENNQNSGLVCSVLAWISAYQHLQNFLISADSTYFSNCVPIKNSLEKSAEIFPASST